jgi:hypothetical protein
MNDKYSTIFLNALITGIVTAIVSVYITIAIKGTKEEFSPIPDEKLCKIHQKVKRCHSIVGIEQRAQSSNESPKKFIIF